MATQDYASLSKRIDGLCELVEKNLAPQRAAGKAFAGEFVRADQPAPWNHGIIKRLSDAYPEADALVHKTLAEGRGGRQQAVGWGKALIKMAGIQYPNLGIVDRSYTPAHLEKDHGFKEVRKTAMAESSGVLGGYTVPPQFNADLLTIAAEDEFFAPKCKVIPMTSLTLSVPMLDITTGQSTGTSPYFGGVSCTWQPEAATISESEPTFRQTEFTAWNLVMYAVSSNQLLQDNGVALDSFLSQLFAQALAWSKEYAFLRGLGAGSSMPLGVLNAPATYNQSKTTASQFLFPDVASMMSRLHVRSWDKAMWIMHPSNLPQLIRMQDYTGSSNVGNNLVWLTPKGSDSAGPFSMKMPAAFFNGLPLYFTEKLPQLGTTGSVMLVDPSYYVIGQRMDLQIAISDQYLFRTNQIAWRVTARCDGRPWLNSTITDSQGWVSSPLTLLNYA